jgi:hypothetical protein
MGVHFHRPNRIPRLIIGGLTADFTSFSGARLFLSLPVVGSCVGNPYTACRVDTRPRLWASARPRLVRWNSVS